MLNKEKNALGIVIDMVLAVMFCITVIVSTMVVKYFKVEETDSFVNVQIIEPRPLAEFDIEEYVRGVYSRVTHQLKVESEILCLQKNIYFEARNQPLEGQIAVGLVTLNRVEDWRYPDTFCGVVYDPYQFSWTHQEVDKKSFLRNNIEKQAWITARKISQMIYSNNVDNYLPSVLHYHADRVMPHWANSDVKRVFTQIGDHIFYQILTV